MKGMQRIICSVLVLVSLLIFTAGTCVKFDRSWTPLVDDIDTLFSTAAYYGSWVGIQIDADAAKQVNHCLADGKLTGHEFFVVTRKSAKLIGDIMEATGEDADMQKLQRQCRLYIVLYLCTVFSSLAAAGLCFIGKGKALPWIYVALLAAGTLLFGSLGDGMKLTFSPVLALLVSAAAPCCALYFDKKAANAPSDTLRENFDQFKKTATEKGRSYVSQDSINKMREGAAESAQAAKERVAEWMSRRARSCYCERCGCRNDDDARWCQHCGAQLGK